MKRFFSISIFMVALAFATNAQSLIKANPFGLAVGVFNACYEMPLSESTSWQLSGSFYTGIGDSDATGFGVGIDYRYYMSKTQEAPRGFYVSPGAGGNFGDGINSIAIRATLGYQWIWASGFVLDLGLGPAYYISLEDDGVTAEFDGIGPSGVIAIGYQF